jgi:hypothetical protein
MTAVRRSLAIEVLPPAGLVALRQTLVRRCHGGWGSSGNTEHEPEGQSAFKAWSFQGQAVFFGRPELTSDVQRRTDIAMTNEAGRT